MLSLAAATNIVGDVASTIAEFAARWAQSFSEYDSIFASLIPNDWAKAHKPVLSRADGSHTLYTKFDVTHPGGKLVLCHIRCEHPLRSHLRGKIVIQECTKCGAKCHTPFIPTDRFTILGSREMIKVPFPEEIYPAHWWEKDSPPPSQTPGGVQKKKQKKWTNRRGVEQRKGSGSRNKGPSASKDNEATNTYHMEPPAMENDANVGTSTPAPAIPPPQALSRSETATPPPPVPSRPGITKKNALRAPEKRAARTTKVGNASNPVSSELQTRVGKKRPPTPQLAVPAITTRSTSLPVPSTSLPVPSTSLPVPSTSTLASTSSPQLPKIRLPASVQRSQSTSQMEDRRKTMRTPPPSRDEMAPRTRCSHLVFEDIPQTKRQRTG